MRMRDERGENPNGKSMKREGRREGMETGVQGCHVGGCHWVQVLALPSTTTHVCQCVFVCGDL